MVTPSQRSALLASVFLAVLFLAACARLIPPQPVENPFMLDGRVVPVSFGSADPALAPLDVTGRASATLAFADFDQSLPVRPRVIRNGVAIASAELAGGAGPARITLRDVRLTMRGWQGADSYDAAPEAQRATLRLDSAATVELEQRSCTALSCTYAVVGSGALGDLVLEGEALTRFLDVATSPPATNAGDVSVSVVAEQDGLAGATLALRIAAPNGLITF